MTPYLNISLSLLMLALCSLCAKGHAFSEMPVNEVARLLDMQEYARSMATSAKDDVMTADSSSFAGPVNLTAVDMVTKVYGVIDPKDDKEACVRNARMLLDLTPEEDEGVLWLETANGYAVDYYGMQPPVSAMARYEAGRDGAADYGYFFIFPYTSESRSSSIGSQSDFCGLLLQEMADCGLAMDLNTATDDLFEAVGEHKGSLVDVRLLDDRHSPDAGRFILILSIEPGAFTPADHILAEY